MNEKKYLVYLHSLWITHKKFFQAFNNTTNYEDFFRNLSFDRLKIIWIDEKNSEKIMSQYAKIDTNKIDNILQKLWVNIISYYDEEYPKSLKEIANPPFFLYIQWTLKSYNSLAIIGSRKISDYGKIVIQKLVPDLVSHFTIVSGWAFWCDTHAHIETLKNNGTTYVVIGTWIDKIYPSSNKILFQDVVKKGWAIVSIFPLGEEGNPYNFPIRNEIISWLSKWIIVIEAWEKSGTLITANLWLEQWKDIFAVPWDITKPWSIGCNMLIATWQAKLITKADDILEEYHLENRKKEKPQFKSITEETIYNLLITDTYSVDELSKKSSISTMDLTINLSMMEINQIVEKSDGWKYKLR